MVFQKINNWLELFCYLRDNKLYTYFVTNYSQTCYSIEQTIREVYKNLSFDAVNLLFSFITILLVIVRALADSNHENEHTSLYNILVFSTICLVICFTTHDLFWFYLGFKSITVPIYYLIHMYRSDIDKFKACDWYALFSFMSRAVLSFAVALLANQYRTTNINTLVSKIELINNDHDLSNMHIIYVSLLIAFMIKSPVVPFHM